MNKKLFFLSLLCITSITQCMKDNRFEFSLTTPDNRVELVGKLALSCPDIMYPYYHENHRFAFDSQHLQLKNWQGVSINGYSFLGFAAIAIHVFPFSQALNGNTKYPKYASYDERKDFIKALLARGFKPTDKDRELAFIIEKEENMLRDDGKSDLLDE
ncbi:MAG TPA: hypothetical protein VKR54_04745 [Candidatus Babeliales bacterium]|nr:hypothetical protein [Candidatus Babeliales bacterium]